MILNRLAYAGSALLAKNKNYLFLKPNSYRFSDQKDPNNQEEPQKNKFQNEKDQNKKKILKSLNYRKLKKELYSGGKQEQIPYYLKRIGNGYLSRYLQKLNYYKNNTTPFGEQQNNKYKNFSNFGQFKNNFFRFRFLSQAFIILLQAFLFLFLYSGYSLVQDNQQDNSVEKIIPSIMYSLQDEQKLISFLSRVKKVYIIPKKTHLTQQQSQKMKESSKNPDGVNSKKTNARLKRLWNQYTIQFIDQSGRKHNIQRYQGDPNALLKLLEDIQINLPKNEKAQIYFKNPEQFTISEAFSETLRLITPLLMIAIPLYFFRKSNPDTMIRQLGQGKKNFKIQSTKNIKVKFDDVAGMQQAKKEITEFVDFLKNSEKYKNIGAKIPKGALLTGPPGTGKTMLAKACAGEANVSFFYISGSEFVEIFVGLGSAKVRSLFEKARQEAPSIIFIDQIDAIGKKRENSRNQEKDSTLNQLLVEMDGFSSSETVIVLAATNRKETLDSALTRPGRFDRMVEVTLPDVQARTAIFMVHLKPLKISKELSHQQIAKRMAELSPGFSGADIANLCNQAAIIASRKNSKVIEQKDFEEAAERITAGYVKNNLANKKTKKRVALHEAGHAVSSWFLKGGDPLVKLTIIPRSKGALGYAQYLPKASFIKTRDQLIDKVAIMLGGITSQKIFFNNMSSGGSDDLQKVYQLTRKMVTQFGMGKSTYNVTMDEETYVQKQSMFLSDMMDAQISLILEEAKTRCRNILQQKRQIVQNLSNALLQKQTLNNTDIIEIMGERPNFQLANEDQLKQPAQKQYQK